MFQALHTHLRALDLKDKEISILECLFSHSQPQTATTISLASKLNRTTTYDILRELMKKGLISKSYQTGVAQYQAIDLSLLPNYIERRQTELASTKKKIEELLPQIALKQSHSDSFPRVRYFEGIDGVKQAYEETIRHNQNKTLFDFTGTDAVYKQMGMTWLHYYWQTRTDLGIFCEVIAPDTAWSRSMQKEDKKFLRNTKFIPNKYRFASEIDIYDNKVGIFSFTNEHPIAVIIEDQTIHDTLKTLFDYVAESAHS